MPEHFWHSYYFGVVIMSIEETKYAVVIRANEFEIRDYESHILAESIVDGDFEDAGSRAFNRLYWFISGDNFPCNEPAVSMTLAERAASTKIKMTSPVGLKGGNGNWAVRFMMPACYTLESLPQPADYGITVHQVPAQRMAVVRSSSFWNERSYLKHRSALERWIDQEGLTALGDPIWARYTEPLIPWFMQRNEVLIPISLV